MPDREEILSLLNQYSYCADSGNVEGLVALYEKGEWAMEGEKLYRGAEELREIAAKTIMYEDGTPRTRHINTNIELDIDVENGTANGRRYLTVVQQTDALPLQPVFSAIYFDEFIKEDGSWRFARTLVTAPLIGDMSHHEKE